MRITCPNCNAQYEIGEDMIPVEGRDVQCSNCATTWFQEGRPRVATAAEERAIRRPARDPEPERAPVEMAEESDTKEEEAASAPVPRRPVPDQATLDILREERAREEELRSAEQDEDAGPPIADERATDEPGEDEPAAVDPAEHVVAEGERDADETEEQDSEGTGAEEEEAEAPDPRATAAAERARMAAAAELARAREAATGSEPERPARQSRIRTTRTRAAEPAGPSEEDMSSVIAETMREASPDGGADGAGLQDDVSDLPVEGQVAARQQSRRELLPDIEEINSSLRPDERAAEAEAEGNVAVPSSVEPAQRSGFRFGFMLICLIVLGFVALYVFAGELSQTVPSMADALAAYSGWVDTQRTALATSVEALTDRIAPDT
ncbi:zinc-ribbon domain-containing protein [Jannaschia sp. S6380]|uniref:zinc-ribbon domain-containing protein n=1 Tax=Jannaschia sp. S6380 TaxID=2926408 RepID=UPI001FF281A4|nr:zinc-ribbon domain-containing protein [Jannaschia sp. S6380]MCK0167620.1 zinc-ribbon domain-containing protein [Jannaschia sp. S6380]